MIRRSSAALLAFPALVALAACSVLSNPFAENDKTGPGYVADLMTRVERIQVESVLSKDCAHEAVETLRSIVGDEFAGDPKAAHADLVAALDRSTVQAEAFAGCIGPMKQAADRVFLSWTEDLESFASAKLRQQSQQRMEETRERFSEIVNAAVASQITFDALNAELNDHALFLEHDFNASSVGMLTGEVDSLRERLRELKRRLDACAEAARNYIEAGATRSQVTPESTAAVPARPAKPSAKATASKPARAKRAPAKTAPILGDDEITEAPESDDVSGIEEPDASSPDPKDLR